MEDYYEILGCNRDVGYDELKSKYQKLALTYHPDKNRDSTEAHNRFVRISRAWKCLSDSEHRQIYDAIRMERDILIDGPINDTVDSDYFSEREGEYVLDCTCGDQFILTDVELQCKLDIVACPTCSLLIIVKYPEVT